MTTLLQAFIHLSDHPLVHALGWTLLHFCWQGIAVAAMLWCVLALLGSRSSQARYGAACLALALMVVLPAATFAHIAAAEYKARAAMLGSGVVLDATLTLQVGADGPIAPWPARIGAALDHAVPWVLLAWFVGVIVFVGRLNFGLLIARRLKTAGTEPPSPALLRLFQDLRIRLGVDRAVELLHSARVQVPTVIGWLRPVVLLPVTCLTGLSPEQIEAVLCHELAHVRRHDYLVSVIQSVIETVLFYHPAVWWVSKQVRRERECCCDELAIGAGGDVLAYARALSFLEENRAPFPEFVLGANGGVLKMRIKRILGNKGDVEGSPVAALVALGMILAVAGSYFAAVSHAQAQAARAEAQTSRDPSSRDQIATAALPAGIVTISQDGATAETNSAQNLHGVYKSWLNEDVRWIITPQERDAFLRLTNDDERDTFINQFWAHRNPPGAAADAYRDEHYARIAYSNQNFASNDQVGWSTDRGHIYIVYGKPQSIDAHPSGGGVSAYPYQVWHYQYIAGIGDNVDLSFVDTCRCGQYNLTIDRPGLPSPATGPAASMPARVTLASRILSPGGAGVPRPATPQSAPPANASQQPGSISGIIVDPNGALVLRAKVTAVNKDTGVKTETQSDDSGVYSTPPLPPGPYIVEVVAPGFQRTLQENVHVDAGQKVGLNFKLTIGGDTTSLTVTGRLGAAVQPPPPPPLPPPAPYRCDGCAAPPLPTGPQRISSGVAQGLALSQRAPVYPEEAKAQHIQGVVVLHARISKDGSIKDVNVISGPPALIVSAIDAVRQWKYKPYLIDGEPTEVDTTVNINYSLSDDKSAPAPDASVSMPAAVMEGNLVHKVDPVYPPIAKAAHLQGVVLLHAVISKTGYVTDLKVLSGPPMLTGSAMEAVRQWQYRPYMLAGVATAVETTITVNFTFQDAKAKQEYRDTLSTVNGLRKIGGSVTSPEVIYKVDPESTPEARNARFMGVVLVNLVVDANGTPQLVHVLRGVGMGLDEKAVEAIKQYKFKPAMEDGKPVPVELNVEVNFKAFDSPKAQTQTPGSSPVAQSAPPTLKDGATAPVLIYKVDPEYSPEARAAKAGGIVLVNFVVDKRGLPQRVHVVRGVGNGLDGKAVEAVKQYKFKPAMKHDKPVQEALNVEVNFQIF